eukprot:1161850-Pelagomonas_calceolata.AAC.18
MSRAKAPCIPHREKKITKKYPSAVRTLLAPFLGKGDVLAQRVVSQLHQRYKKEADVDWRVPGRTWHQGMVVDTSLVINGKDLLFCTPSLLLTLRSTRCEREAGNLHRLLGQVENTNNIRTAKSRKRKRKRKYYVSQIELRASKNGSLTRKEEDWVHGHDEQVQTRRRAPEKKFGLKRSKQGPQLNLNPSLFVKLERMDKEVIRHDELCKLRMYIFERAP